MPKLPNAPGAEQQAVLSKDRAVSSIPKAGDSENWVYPSQQQFYNALLRKDKDPEADTMDAVVHVHNVTNEISWRHILEWEKMHHRSCPTPSLLRFVGRPFDLSWGAWWSRKFSYRGEPFDRHDWFVDRCGQKVVRYVIDYYDDPKASDRTVEITVDARPAFDNVGAAMDRLRRPVWHVQRVWHALFGFSDSGE